MLRPYLLPRLYRETKPEPGDEKRRYVEAKPNHWTSLQWAQARMSQYPKAYFREVARVLPGLWVETGRGWSLGVPELVAAVPSSALRCAIAHRRFHITFLHVAGRMRWLRTARMTCNECGREWGRREIALPERRRI